MTTANLFTETSDISTEDYCVFGVATCFVRDDGEIHQVEVIEPIPSAALETLITGIPTSYKFVCAKTVAEFMVGDEVKIPGDFPATAQLCHDFLERLASACRTYKSRPEAKKHVSVGSVYEDLNYSTERKRILNAQRVVTKNDNVKQHDHTHKVL